ncbi:HlyD family efflux transporter periplasmic adaptor subunit [Enhygromyxa salina]|nr:HlyD family secretion protein [Enhygromyxa salina]
MLVALRAAAAADDPNDLTRIVEELAMDWIGDRAFLRFHDSDDGTLWSAVDDKYEVDATRGLAGAALLGRELVTAPRAEQDPAYAACVDDPRGAGDERVAAMAVAAAAPDRSAHAVLIVIREAARERFDARARGRLTALGHGLSPILDRLALAAVLDAGATLEVGGEDSDPAYLYRAEALEAYRGGHSQGPVLRLASPWLGVVYRVVVGLVVATLAYLCLVDVGEYSSGPALVRLGGRTQITALTDASVVEVFVAPNDRVEAGQQLVRLHDVDDAADSERLEREFELQLRNLLRDPGDVAAQRAVTTLRAERERTAWRLREHLIRAPAAGVIRDVRARPGQALAAGEVLLTIASEQTQPHVLALLPGDDRPRIEVGMPLVFEIDGYRDADRALRVDHVYEDVVGPSEALRVLGPEVADDMSITGPVVLVRAALPSEDFESKAARFRYHDGMRGRAEIQVRTTSVLEALIPSLEEI